MKKIKFIIINSMIFLVLNWLFSVLFTLTIGARIFAGFVGASLTLNPFPSRVSSYYSQGYNFILKGAIFSYSALGLCLIIYNYLLLKKTKASIKEKLRLALLILLVLYALSIPLNILFANNFVWFR